MAKAPDMKSDFAQKLLSDLRRRREMLAAAPAIPPPISAPRGAAAVTRSPDAMSNRVKSSCRVRSQEIVPHKRAVKAPIAFSVAIDKAGKLRDIEIFSNTRASNGVRTSISVLQLHEILRSQCSSGDRKFSRSAVEMGRQLLKGALNVEEFLSNLGMLKDASDQHRTMSDSLACSPVRLLKDSASSEQPSSEFHRNIKFVEADVDAEYTDRHVPTMGDNNSIPKLAISGTSDAEEDVIKARKPGVIARLMGLEELPSCVVGETGMKIAELKLREPAQEAAECGEVMSKKSTSAAADKNGEVQRRWRSNMHREEKMMSSRLVRTSTSNDPSDGNSRRDRPMQKSISALHKHRTAAIPNDMLLKNENKNPFSTKAKTGNDRANASKKANEPVKPDAASEITVGKSRNSVERPLRQSVSQHRVERPLRQSASQHRVERHPIKNKHVGTKAMRSSNLVETSVEVLEKKVVHRHKYANKQDNEIVCPDEEICKELPLLPSQDETESKKDGKSLPSAPSVNAGESIDVQKAVDNSIIKIQSSTRDGNQEQEQRSSPQDKPAEEQSNFRSMLMADPSFLLAAKTIFGVQTPPAAKHARSAVCLNKEHTLTRDCMMEIMERKGKREAASASSMLSAAKRIQSLDTLVDALELDLERLPCCVRDDHDTAEIIQKLLARDLHNVFPDVNSMWDINWCCEASLPPLVQMHEIAAAIESHILSVITLELAAELTRVQRRCTSVELQDATSSTHCVPVLS